MTFWPIAGFTVKNMTEKIKITEQIPLFSVFYLESSTADTVVN